ncbi:MAG: hypothetical protein NTW08_03845 [Gammaproteobacteria bacterium]|nr:hypothetical protein [Gammaproteobacteria bacterium]
MFITKATIRTLKTALTGYAEKNKSLQSLDELFDRILVDHNACEDSAPIAVHDIKALFVLYNTLSMETDKNCIACTELLAASLLGYSEPYRINQVPNSYFTMPGAVQKFPQTKQVEWNQKSQQAVSQAADLLPNANLESIYDGLRKQRALILTHDSLQHCISAIRSTDNKSSQIQEGIELTHEPKIIGQKMEEIFKNQLTKRDGYWAMGANIDNGHLTGTWVRSGQDQDAPGYRIMMFHTGGIASIFILNPPKAFNLEQANNTYKATLAKLDERYFTPLKTMPVRTEKELQLFFNQLGEFIYDMVEACFLIRGAASVNKWLYRAIIQSKLGAPFELTEGLPYDLEAFAYINKQDFAEAFAKRYDYLAPLMKAEKKYTRDVALSENRYGYLSARREDKMPADPKQEAPSSVPA